MKLKHYSFEINFGNFIFLYVFAIFSSQKQKKKEFQLRLCNNKKTTEKVKQYFFNLSENLEKKKPRVLK
jgi:hypothetical protein